MTGDALDPGTGSLTGHILRQGHPDPRRGDGHGRHGVKIALGVLGALVILTLIGAALFLTGVL